VGRGAVAGSIYAIDYAEIKLPLATDDLAYLDLPMDYRESDGGAGGASSQDAGRAAVVSIHAELAGRRHTWMGRVVRTDGAIDPTSRRLNAIARVDDPYGRSGRDPERPPLAVGLFVDAAIEGRSVSGVFVVPRAALRPGDRVLVVDAEDRLRVHEVSVLRRTREHAVIREGLATGDRVVVSPMEAPVDGMAVRPHAGESPLPRGEG
jgi:multidrug efflux pump subunit AcrA (membrane-fusion protein)